MVDSQSSYPKANCPKIEQCNKLKTHDFFRLTCMDDYEICNVFDGTIDLGNENKHPREWVHKNPSKWWLISDEDVQTIKKGLTGALLRTLESGLHITDVIPADFQSSPAETWTMESLSESYAEPDVRHSPTTAKEVE